MYVNNACRRYAQALKHLRDASDELAAARRAQYGVWEAQSHFLRMLTYAFNAQDAYEAAKVARDRTVNWFKLTIEYVEHRQ